MIVSVCAIGVPALKNGALTIDCTNITPCLTMSYGIRINRNFPVTGVPAHRSLSPVRNDCRIILINENLVAGIQTRDVLVFPISPSSTGYHSNAPIIIKCLIKRDLSVRLRGVLVGVLPPL